MMKERRMASDSDVDDQAIMTINVRDGLFSL